jgi:sulfatase maturation enzyme AslB (radical SAM superfamily)
MADDLLEEYIRQLIEAHAHSPLVTIAWQGGEPTLMGLDFFRRSVELTRQYLRRGQRAEHTIQTNGTLLDDEWAAFFKANDFLVGISIDGPRELHDRYRFNKGGKGSFDDVTRGLDQKCRAPLRRTGLGCRNLFLPTLLATACGAPRRAPCDSPCSEHAHTSDRRVI